MQLISMQHTSEKSGPGRPKPPSHMIRKNNDFAFFRRRPAFISRNTPIYFFLRRRSPSSTSSFNLFSVTRLSPQLAPEVFFLDEGRSLPVVALLPLAGALVLTMSGDSELNE